MEKGPDAFRTISEVAEDLGLPQHVLRFWETRFGQIKPLKRGGGRRYYRPDDVELLQGIRHLLYGEGYTIRGVQQILREQGVRHVQEIGVAVKNEEAGTTAPSAPSLGGAVRLDEEDDSVEPAEVTDRSRSSLMDLLPSLRTNKPAPDLPRVVEVPMPQAPVKAEEEDMPPFPFRRSAPRPVEPALRPIEPTFSASPAAPRVEPPVSMQTSGSGKFSPEAVRLLKSTLYELGECQRMLEAARMKGS